MAEETGRVLGIGGVFFKSEHHDELREWYQSKLGLDGGENQGVKLPWKDLEGREQFTIWSVFPARSTYYDGEFMINYIVDDLDALLGKLEAQGVRIDPKREDYDYGRFAWIYDPDGAKIELWEPAQPIR